MEQLDIGSFEYYTKIVDGKEVSIPKPDNFKPRYARGAYGPWYDLVEQKEMPEGWEPNKK